MWRESVSCKEQHETFCCGGERCEDCAARETFHSLFMSPLAFLMVASYFLTVFVVCSFLVTLLRPSSRQYSIFIAFLNTLKLVVVVGGV